MPILQLFDSSVLIPWLRTQRYDDLVASAFESRRFILSTVVAMELYAGTRSRGDKQDLDRIVQSLSSVDRMVWPAPEDFYTAIGKHSRKISDGYSNRLTCEPHVLGIDRYFLVRQAL